MQKSNDGDDLIDLSKVKGLTKIYIKILSFLTNHPLKIISFSLILLVSIYVTYSKYGNGVNFFPSVDAENTKVVIIISRKQSKFKS